MDYKETLEWLFTQLPMYQRVGKAAYKPDLSNTEYLMELLSHPQNGFKSVHVAGTNGKGSVSHMLASVFQTAGYKTGLYTSPHLKDFRERIRINGEVIPEQEVTEFIKAYKAPFIERELSFFEMTVGLAFDHFKQHKVDIAIVETGMGGRLDSTNVLKPELSIITNISLDHQAYLGDNLAQIAQEKAGIIKKNTAVVIGESLSETETVFRAKAQQQNSEIHFAEDNKRQLPESDLKGFYQRKNIQTALCAFEFLEKKGYSLENAISEGLQNVVKNTGLRGRWEELNQSPRIICDTGHNENAVTELIQQINAQDFEKLHIVWGMVNDKDSNTILNLLPTHATYYFCKPNIPRGKNAQDLRSEALQYGLMGEYYPNAAFALAEAQKKAHPKDMIFIGGSTFVVADILP
jgi:dihydrofolate synthase/folylpolyglutamate synthase